MLLLSPSVPGAAKPDDLEVVYKAILCWVQIDITTLLETNISFFFLSFHAQLNIFFLECQSKEMSAWFRGNIKMNKVIRETNRSHGQPLKPAPGDLAELCLLWLSNCIPVSPGPGLTYFLEEMLHKKWLCRLTLPASISNGLSPVTFLLPLRTFLITNACSPETGVCQRQEHLIPHWQDLEEQCWAHGSSCAQQCRGSLQFWWGSHQAPETQHPILSTAIPAGLLSHLGKKDKARQVTTNCN